MGALHTGHISLIERAQARNQFTLCSIFVNPTQFNDAKDLKKYPKPLSEDRRLLDNAGCNFLFTPSVKEIYPNDLIRNWKIDLNGLDTGLEGKFRPGHFAGVVQVVKRFLDIVQPDQMFMGQKDFQQFSIINYMIKSLDIPTELIMCPIVREKNGLAMSSRNRRLSPEMREKAGLIFNTLTFCKKQAATMDLINLGSLSFEKMKQPGFTPEYFSIIDGNTLQKVTDYKSHRYIVACTAIWAGEVRLIDNMILKNEV